MPGRIDRAGQHARRGGGSGLTGQADVQHGFHVVEPRQLDRRAGDQHGDDRLPGLRQRGHQIVLHLRDRHRGAVEPFGFAALVKADDGKDRVDVAMRGESDRILNEHAVLGAMAVVSLLIPGNGDSAHGRELVKQVLVPRGVHLGRSGTLEACGLGHVTDHRDAGAGLERQRGGRVVAFADDGVLEQHRRVFGHLAGHLVVRRGDAVLEQIVAADAGKPGRRGDFRYLGGTGVEIRLGQGAGPDGPLQLAHGSETGRGHFKGSAGLDRGDRGVRSAPVGDDHAVEAPFVAQDVLQQVLVLVRVHAVDLVVGGHDRHRRGLAHGYLERGEIDLAHRAFVDHGIGGLPAQFLAVDREVLRAGGYAVGLDAADQAGRHAPRDDRILGIVLEVAAAQWIALDVHARSEQHVHVEIVGFLAERLAHLLGERRIPRIGDRAGRGEAGCGFGRFLGDRQFFKFHIVLPCTDLP